jgi:hypothetical protein
MWGFLGSLFGKVFGGGEKTIIPERIDVEIDFWEKNKLAFILIFLMVALIIVAKL